MADIKKALALKKHTNPTTKVLVCHHNNLEVFLWKEANKLAEHQPYNHKIVLGSQLGVVIEKTRRG